MSELQDLNKRIAALEDTVAQLAVQNAMSEFDSGDTSWVLISAVLVLFMTIPGLVLFYAGMVRTKNVLATVMQVYVPSSALLLVSLRSDFCTIILLRRYFRFAL